jgi:ribosomal protein RSM22 (predicted rRNA methylase)
LTGAWQCKADVVILAYALNELPQAIFPYVIDRLWDSTLQALVIVDPGIPESYGRMMAVRAQLIQRGACLAAPCATCEDCPLPAGDWCHFSRRVARTSLHRSVKGGELSYEDEKFCFLTFTRNPVQRSKRILRHPLYHKGFVQLSLCTPEGLASLSVSRSQGAAYKAARDAAWGDAWEDPEAKDE